MSNKITDRALTDSLSIKFSKDTVTIQDDHQNIILKIENGDFDEMKNCHDKYWETYPSGHEIEDV